MTMELRYPMGQLTKEQMKAVSHKQGPACVIAGAGTGKTTALAERILYLLEGLRLDPSRIVVTTFTRKATAELYDRTHERLGEVAQRLRISTIDALIRDLAQRAAHRGLMPPARLIGEAEQRLLLLHCAWETSGQPDAYSRSSWTQNADKAGLVGLLETCIRAQMAKGQEKQTIRQSIRSKLAEMQNRFCLYLNFRIPTSQELKLAVENYFAKLNELGATDHDLLTSDFLRCLTQHKTLAKEFASEFDAILVDEFQDTSRLQAEILLSVSRKGRNIWVVGDPCQQIYEWRGAGPENLVWFIKKTGAKKYYLTDNWRSTQAILDCAYYFLSRRVPTLRKNGMLKPLKPKRNTPNNQDDSLPIFTGTLDRAFFLVRRLLDFAPDLRPSEIAVLSRKLDKRTVKEIEQKAVTNGLIVQFHSSRADRAAEETIGDPPNWRAGKALTHLYSHPKIQNLISRSLRKSDFTHLRTLRPIAVAAEALDSTLPPQAFTFREAWPALKKTQDREVSITSAITSSPESIQVMTIHAAKGLEFPVVLLMKLGKGGPRSFPSRKSIEDARLAYVGATRARDLLVLVHTTNKPKETLADFGPNLVPIRRNRREPANSKIEPPAVLHTPPIIAASHLDLYEQCPLKFAAYHEGRFLPKWTPPQSMGARMHKALEYYLRAEMPTSSHLIDRCFERGFQDGDSPLRKLPLKSVQKMKRAYKEIGKGISEFSGDVLMLEKRYTYIQGNSGQTEGVADALIEQKDGTIVLKEWKTQAEIAPTAKRQYELQARVAALGIGAQKSHEIQRVEIVPLFQPKNTLAMAYDKAFVEASQEMLEQVFRDLRDRSYEPERGNHCNFCQLKPQCPAWRKS